MEEQPLGRAGLSRATPVTPLSNQECWALLRSHTLGRVAVMVDGRPEIFPVNYRAGDDAIVFRTAPGAKLANAPMTLSCFEIDGWDDRTGTGWSVMLHGPIFEITDAADRRAASLRELAVRPAAPGERNHWLALYAEAVTGRRFTSGPLAPEVIGGS